MLFITDTFLKRSSSNFCLTEERDARPCKYSMSSIVQFLYLMFSRAALNLGIIFCLQCLSHILTKYNYSGCLMPITPFQLHFSVQLLKMNHSLFHKDIYICLQEVIVQNLSKYHVHSSKSLISFVCKLCQSCTYFIQIMTRYHGYFINENIFYFFYFLMKPCNC